MNPSIIIPARNEAVGLSRLLPELAGFDVTVVANGCVDDTVTVAKSAGVRVAVLPAASKAAALDAGDALAVAFPRVYLDADVRVSAVGLRALIAAFDSPGVLAATMHRRLDVTGCSLPLRGYYAVQSRLPAYRTALYGRGVIAVSAIGRARWDSFGELIGDDLFLDRLFSDTEKRVTDEHSVIEVPTRTTELIRRLARVRAGTAQQGPTGTKTAWLRVSAPRPWLWPAACCYAGITLAAEARRRRPAQVTWD